MPMGKGTYGSKRGRPKKTFKTCPTCPSKAACKKLASVRSGLRNNDRAGCFSNYL